MLFDTAQHDTSFLFNFLSVYSCEETVRKKKQKIAMFVLLRVNNADVGHVDGATRYINPVAAAELLRVPR